MRDHNQHAATVGDCLVKRLFVVGNIVRLVAAERQVVLANEIQTEQSAQCGHNQGGLAAEPGKAAHGIYNFFMRLNPINQIYL